MGVKETSVHVGEVDFARTAEHSFAVRNDGDRPLRLTLAKKSCSCGEIQLPEGDIPPGEERMVRIRWTPIPGSIGPYALSAEMETNDDARSVVRLEIRGNVQPQVRIDPPQLSYLDFGRLRPGVAAVRELRVFSIPVESFGLDASLTDGASRLGLSAVVVPLKSGTEVGEFRIRSGYLVAVKSDGALPAGYLRETLLLTIRTPGEAPRTIEIPVYGEVETGVVRIAPTEVEFSKPRIAEADTKKVRVQFLVPSPEQRIEVVRCEPSFLLADAPTRLNEQGLWQFNVSIQANHPDALRYQAEGFFEGRVLLKVTGEPSELAIRVKWLRAGR